MKRFTVFALVSTVLALASAVTQAETGSGLKRQPRAVSRPARQDPRADRPAGRVTLPPIGYSVQLNIVTRVVGLALYRTAVDITNNTGDRRGRSASFQYCYTAGGVFQECTRRRTSSCTPYDNFHTDDIIEYVGSAGPHLPRRGRQLLRHVLRHCSRVCRPTTAGRER